MINVTKTFLPPLEEYTEKLKQIWETHWVTNQGPMAEELENRLKEYLGVKNLMLVSNGTIALQIAIKALELCGEIITTPYSYVATTTSILWENCTPVFCDIEDKTFCINADKIESLITDKTTGIIATDVYGFPCDFEKIKSIADKYDLKVIYDGAHAFGVKVNGNSLFSFGDISTVSFHATKLFHTIEGGAVITNDDKLYEKMYLYRAFGHLDDDYISLGINGRTSEFHAAMGLCNLPRVSDFIRRRKEINLLYRNLLKNIPVIFPAIPADIEYNYSYFPVIFPDEDVMLKVKKALLENEIGTRRYFYPSLNKLPYLKGNDCPVSENTASRVLCLPLFQELVNDEIVIISGIISEFFK
ncbi:MAG TPA: DegT/DnrJ/EryC1/StrS family aminotransferase [Ignavibacteria bacterium]|nr:DegT/DnrJ/EryC1/StrS family aminotransferase [Ignavibacteria bacterium]